MKILCLALILTVIIPCCSSEKDIDLFKEAQALEDQRNFKTAIGKYSEIVDKFGESVFADSSQYKIALLYNNELKDFSSAVSAYLKYFTVFPGSKNAPVALFMAGFIMNNEMHKLDSARIYFDMFLQKYPQHELAASARFELETLGKDPTEFLKSEITLQTEGRKNKTGQ